MKCVRCGRCCKDTMMELSERDILRLINLGYRKEDMCIVGPDGIPRLRNVEGVCYFLSKDGKVCTVYDDRPTGCDLYPVNCDQHGNIFVDDFCQAEGTVSKEEARRKGRALRRHIAIIDKEAEARKKKGT